MQIDVVTLFPEMVEGVIRYGVVSRAARQGLINLRCWNPRDYVDDPHRTVDDRPYGGGPGMVMKFEPLMQAIRAAKSAGQPASVIYLSPQGRVLNQAYVKELVARPRLILVAGRYEGIDERVVTSVVDEELSIGDYVLSGGELAAMVVMDAVVRMIPGVLGDAESADQDSFCGGLLDYPHYTRPEILAEGCVPDVLLSGNHERIQRWRLQQSLGRTWMRRPDLLNGQELTKEQSQLLQEFIQEQRGVAPHSQEGIGHE